MSGFDNGTLQGGVFFQAKQFGSILRGFGPPVPQAGVVGDLYIDVQTWFLYNKRGPLSDSPWGRYLFQVPATYQARLKWFSADAPGNDVGTNGDYCLLWGGFPNYGMQPSIYGPKAAGAWPATPTAVSVIIHTTDLVVSVGDFGAAANGATDDLLPFQRALASGAKVVWCLPTTYRLSAGVTVPEGVTLLADGFSPSNPPAGCVLKFDLGVATCVTLGAAASNGASSLRGITVARAAGTPSTTSIGVLVRNEYNVVLEDVQSVGHGVPLYVKANGVAAGISLMATRVFTGTAYDAHVVIDSWPEARFSQCRFGMVGNGDVSCAAYVRVTGGSTVNPASGPNSVDFTQCQFNMGGAAAPKATRFVEFVNIVSGSISDTAIFKFVGCHMEGYLGGIKTDASLALLQRLYLIGNSFNSGVEFWDINPATLLSYLYVAGNTFPGTFTLGSGQKITRIQITGNSFDSAAQYTGESTSYLASSGNTYRGGLTLAGAWQVLDIDDIAPVGNIINNITSGTWSVKVPGATLKSWTPTLAFGGAAVGVTYTVQSGVISIVGNKVTAQYTITLSSKGSSAGNAGIGGLPVLTRAGENAASSLGCGGTVNYGGTMAGLVGAIVPRFPSGLSLVDLYQWGPTGTVRVTDANFTNTTTIAGTIEFFR